MKTGIKLLIILMGLIVGGCEYGISPEIPAPLSPDGEDYTIEDGKMLFSWEAVQGAQKYAIEIGADRRFTERVYFYVVYGVTDHAVSLDYFEPNEDYFWRVAAYLDADLADWSNPVKFTYVPPFIDLDTTYFPFGLGYEWCYERHDWGYDHEFPWDTTYTYTVTVTDSFWVGDTLNYKIETSRGGGGIHPHYFWEIQTPVKISHDSLIVSLWVYSDTVFVCQPDTVSLSDGDFSISYVDTTLVIRGGIDYYGNGNEYETRTIKRVKGIGTILQSFDYWSSGGLWDQDISDRLLYFYDGTDTLYKAPEEALYIQSLPSSNSGLSEDSQKWLR